MTRITAVWTLSLLLLSGAASADPEPWMEKEDPDDLTLIVRIASECPDDQDAYIELVQRIFMLSRLNPTASDGLGLYADLQCFSLPDPERYVFIADVSFVQRDGSSTMSFEDQEYLAYGLGGPEEIRVQLREQTELAITDYLKANFDL